MSEREIQKDLVKALRGIGFIVWVTSTNRASRNTTGTPDLFVGLPMSSGLCLGLEVKAPNGKATPEQMAEEVSGSIVIVRSVEEGINASIKYRMAAAYSRSGLSKDVKR